ncbi:excalibur calcium-binding domain-containing protein [Nocardia sp. NPDC059240]|uniref:excalibur calcium-binding domain-containing protein n=1 Tax=Nocardia sp. NPDC059240 TaxID=3346786 RepID=UPI0036CC2549
MKHRSTFRTRAATLAALGVFGIVMPLGAIAPVGWSTAAVAQANPADNAGGDNSGAGYEPNSLARGDATPPKADKKAKPDPIYSSCEQVWEHGGGPIYEGQPGYSAYLDPNGTGVACSR